MWNGVYEMREVELEFVGDGVAGLWLVLVVLRRWRRYTNYIYNPPFSMVVTAHALPNYSISFFVILGI